jgi:hypothetical protein
MDTTLQEVLSFFDIDQYTTPEKVASYFLKEMMPKPIKIKTVQEDEPVGGEENLPEPEV